MVDPSQMGGAGGGGLQGPPGGGGPPSGAQGGGQGPNPMAMLALAKLARRKRHPRSTPKSKKKHK
jgi:hypothetical protein